MGKFRRVLVSPEIAISQEFGVSVLSKKTLQDQLRCFVVDEAHCVCEWGGSFRPDYTKIGALRGRIRKSVPFVVASATLPSHVLDVVKKELNIDANPIVVSLTNERRNVILVTRPMKFDELSMGDLRFTIPREAKVPQDVPITLIYANTRASCETIYDRLKHFSPTWLHGAIAYYHAKIGQKKKRRLEERLRKGKVRIMICTDAVGMVSSLLLNRKEKYLSTMSRDAIYVTSNGWFCGICPLHFVLWFSGQGAQHETCQLSVWPF